MPDFIQVYHPDRPESITYMEREAFRQWWAHQGWTSLSDPGGLGPRYVPGTELDVAVIESDIARASTTWGEFSSSLRVTVPQAAQPIVLSLVTQLTVTDADAADGAWTVAFSPVSGVASVLNAKGARQFTPPVLATGGVGLSVVMEVRLASPVTGQDWTIACQRESGNATALNMKGNSIFGGFLAVRAA